MKKTAEMEKGMRTGKKLTAEILSGKWDEALKKLYMDNQKIQQQKKRYVKAVASYCEIFGEMPVEIYSAPGRSEVGGNHTDHQHGRVLAASVSLDAIAVAGRVDEPLVRIQSEGYKLCEIRLDELDKKTREEGTTKGLIRGVLAGLKQQGYKMGGFCAYITSDVLSGSGLSSSATFETLIGTVVSGLYNHAEIPAVTIAQTGRYAENVYFGKPSGLMDQMACAIGGMVYIDFENEEKP
jgi:galactokinase